MKDFEHTQFPGKDGSDIRQHDDKKELEERIKKYFNEGPQQFTIPQRTFTSCSRCKYLSHQMVHSGRNPLYADNCEHPETIKEHRYGFMEGNLHKNIFGVIETPEWCPFLKPKQNEETKTTEGAK